MYRVVLRMKRGEPSPVEFGQFHYRPEDQPYFPGLRPNDYDAVGLYHCWWVDPDIHSTFQGSYKFWLADPFWVFEFDNPRDFTLFKLTWGGR